MFVSLNLLLSIYGLTLTGLAYIPSDRTIISIYSLRSLNIITI